MNRTAGIAAAALILAATAGAFEAAAQQSIGRLFFTPQERAALDAARERPVQPRPAAAAPEAAPAAPPAPVTLDGIVRRSDGATTVWVNGAPLTWSRTADGIRVVPASRGSVSVALPESGRRIELGVGQRLDLETGEVRDGYRLPAQTSAPPSGAGDARGAASRDRERSERGGPGAPVAAGGR